MSNAGMDRNSQVLFALLVLWASHREKAATGQYLLEELLGRKTASHGHSLPQPQPTVAHTPRKVTVLSWRSGSLRRGDFCKQLGFLLYPGMVPPRDDLGPSTLVKKTCISPQAILTHFSVLLIPKWHLLPNLISPPCSFFH